MGLVGIDEAHGKMTVIGLHTLHLFESLGVPSILYDLLLKSHNCCFQIEREELLSKCPLEVDKRFF
jgi:hypothetical protein